jgi:hypothetical protein
MLPKLSWVAGWRAEDIRCGWQDRARGCELLDRLSKPVGGIQLDERIGLKDVFLKQLRLNKLPDLVIGNREKAPDVPLVVRTTLECNSKTPRGVFDHAFYTLAHYYGIVNFMKSTKVRDAVADMQALGRVNVGKKWASGAHTHRFLCMRLVASLIQRQKLNISLVFSVPGGEIQLDPELGEILFQRLSQLSQVLLLALARFRGSVEMQGEAFVPGAVLVLDQD